jgi:hypothetical protein
MKNLDLNKYLIVIYSMYRIFIHPDTIDSVLHIHKEMQKGGGRTTVPSYSQYGSKSQSLLQTFQKTGWKQSALQKRFKNLDDSMIQNGHVQNEERLRAFVDIWYNEIGEFSTIQDMLIKLGLQKQAAKRADVAISPLLNTCYTYSQLIQIAIHYLMGYYDPITPSTTTHFYKPEIVNSWIVYPTHRGKHISVMNFSKSCAKSHIHELNKIIHHTFFKPTHNLFFHTTSWRYCKRIFKELNHLSGQPCLDFGIRPSFYMSEKIKYAIEWGTKKQTQFSNELGTIIFSIPKKLPPDIYYKDLIDEEWSDTILKSRTCVVGIPDDENISEVNGYDLVYGDMLANSQDLTSINQFIPRPHTPPKKQLASKTTYGDTFIKGCMVGCIFYNKNESST